MKKSVSAAADTQQLIPDYSVSISFLKTTNYTKKKEVDHSQPLS